MDIRDVIKLRQDHERQFVQETVLFNGTIITRNGSTSVQGIYNHVWVQPWGDENEPVAVYNRNVKSTRPGMDVVCGFAGSSSVLEILRTVIDASAGVEPTEGTANEPHANSHRPGGDDVLYIDPRVVVPLLVYPTGQSGLFVHVGSYVYWNDDGTSQTFPGYEYFDLSSYEPVSGALLVLIYLDKTTNDLVVVSGTATVDSRAIIPDRPALPAGGIGACFVRIAAAQTSFTSPDFFDARDFFGGGGGSGGGWPFDNVLSVSPTNAAATEATLPAAVTAADSGDTIHMDAGTYALTSQQAIAKSLTIEGDGPEATVIEFDLASNACFDFSADSITVVFRNLTIDHNAGGGSTAGVFFTNNTGVRIVLDNAVIKKSGGTPGTGYGFWMEGGTLEMRNEAKILVTSGTTRYGIWNDSGSVVVIIGPGCEVEGSTYDIYGTVGGSTLSLSNPKLTNGLLSWAGTINDQSNVSKLMDADFGTIALATDTAGALIVQTAQPVKGKSSNFPALGTTTLAEKIGSIYLGTAKDVYAYHDQNPLFNRVINKAFTPLEHWANGADELTWAGFAGYTGFSNPPNTVSYSNSRIGIAHTSGATRYFYYRSGFTSLTNKQIFAFCAPRVNAQAGIMIDDGVNNADGNGANNFYRIFLDWTGGGTTYAVLTVERRTGGGAVTTTTLFNLIPSTLYGLGISATGTLYTSWTSSAFFFNDLPISTVASVTSQTWTPARMGLYGRQNAGGSALQGNWDWWTEL